MACRLDSVVEFEPRLAEARWLAQTFKVHSLMDISDGLAGDLRPHSPFLRHMATHEPPGAVYTTIGGDPWLFRWLRRGHHGFDGAVPAESADSTVP